MLVAHVSVAVPVVQEQPDASVVVCAEAKAAVYLFFFVLFCEKKREQQGAGKLNFRGERESTHRRRGGGGAGGPWEWRLGCRSGLALSHTRW